MKKSLAMILMALLMVLSTGQKSYAADDAPDSGELKANGDYRIAFIQKNMDNQYFIDCDNGSAQRAEELGITVDFFTPEGGYSDFEGQINIMNDCITQAYDIIMIDVLDDYALIPSIVAANEADIPVILFNDPVDEDELAAQGGHYETFIGLDSYQGSKLVGEYCSKTSEPGKVLIVEGQPNAENTRRVDGFTDGLSEGFEVVASQVADGDMNKAYDVVTNVFTATPDVSIVFAINSNMGLGAIQALKDMGVKDQVDVYDFDCTNEDLAAIQDGDLLATLRYPTIEWARLGVDTCVRILNGETVEKELYTDIEVVDAERAAELLQ